MSDVQKVAFATDDGTNINRHFGRLRGFVVVALADGTETARQMLQRPLDADNPGGGHNHGALLSPIADCRVLIAGGMGLPMARQVAESGLELMLTSLTSIDEALDRYVTGTLVHEANRAHAPRH